MKMVNRVDVLNRKLQRNLSIFNNMISNITKLNGQIEVEIAEIEDEILAKQEEIVAMRDIKSQNEKIKINFEALIK